MNRTQLPGELKAAFCQQIQQGKWTVEQAADISTYSVQSVKRWLRDIESASEAAAPKPKPAEPRKLDPDLRRIFDEALERVPRCARGRWCNMLCATTAARFPGGWRLPTSGSVDWSNPTQ